MISVEQLERLLDHAHGAVAGALFGFSGNEGLIPAGLHDRADVLLTPALRTAVDRRGVDVVDAQIEGAIDDRDSGVEVVWLLKRSLAAKAEDPNLVAGLPE